MIDRAKLKELHTREEKRFVAEHPRSAELYARAKDSLLGGVPMNWMKKWAGAFPIFVAHANGAHFTDLDGREYVDLCLGDTGAMTGGGGDCEAGARRHYADAADGGCAVGGRRVEAAVWIALLAICTDSDGREPVCNSNCARDYAAIEGAGLQLLLSRNSG
jgi:glutamate-1-semialdehyde aminotransferase